METAHGIAELRAAVTRWRRGGQRVAFVPTMGNLHRGHLELIRRARAAADKTVASVFVNPLQFGAGEDFDKYPRTFEQDRAALEQAHCDLLFAPSAKAIYPNGMHGLTRVVVPELSTILCGQYRPGHFEGVATVVNILFNLVQPDVALFGEKDYQQLQVIRQMVADLRLPLEVLGIATERETDGLALSSRNQYLNAAERARAPDLYRVLRQAADRLQNGSTDYPQIEDAAVRELAEKGFKPQYVEVRTAALKAPTAETREWVVLAAAYLGTTRLIDNIKISRS